MRNRRRLLTVRDDREVLRGDATALFSLAPPPHAGDAVLFLYINFAIRERDISGYIAMINANPSIDPSGISISQYSTYFVPLKQSNRLVCIAGGKDVVASIVQFIGCGQTDECFIFDN
jgi:hypothetical protein